MAALECRRQISGADEIHIEGGKRNLQLRKVIDRFSNVRELAPSGLPELPAPIKANSQQEFRLQGIRRAKKPAKVGLMNFLV
jgi:hypothetical protein